MGAAALKREVQLGFTTFGAERLSKAPEDLYGGTSSHS